MIRAVAVLSLVTLLILVLYVPSAHSPERFASQLRTEREAAVAYWGSDPATRMLDRAIRMQETIADVTPIPAAKDALSQLVFGKAVELEPFEQDRYDRLVARVWLDGPDVNAAMIKSGNAWTYRRYADDPAYCTYEQAARDLGRGLWRLPANQRVAPWEWRQRKARAGHFTDYSQETVATCVAALGR